MRWAKAQLFQIEPVSSAIYSLPLGAAYPLGKYLPGLGQLGEEKHMLGWLRLLAQKKEGGKPKKPTK